MRVFVADWQHECCGSCFSVGDRIDWNASALGGDEALSALGAERYEDHHDTAGNTTPLIGSVRRIQVVTQEHERADGRVWVPLPGRFSLREVERSPEGFESFMPGVTGRAWWETGMLVDLDIDG